MRTILVLLRKDFAYFRRDRGTIILTFLVPFALIYLFGQIFGVNRKDGGPSAIPVAVADESGGVGDKLVTALKAETAFHVITDTDDGKGGKRRLRESDLTALIRAGKFHFALVLPADFSSARRFGLHLKLLSDPRNTIETQTVSGLLEKTIFTAVPELIGQSLQRSGEQFAGMGNMDRFNGRIADAVADTFGGNRAEILQRMKEGNFGLSPRSTASRAGGTTGTAADGTGVRDLMQQIVRLDRQQVVGSQVKSPMATQLVGGWAMQFLLFALVASATSLFHEKDHGIFQRILSGPVPRSAILWSKFIYGVVLGVLQLGILFAAGRVLFGIEIGRQLPLLLLVGVFAGAACSAFGMLLAAVATTPEMARGLSTFVILIMSAIGGAWFPVSFMPAFIQQFSRLTLVYWSIEGFLQVLWARASLVQILPILGVLAGMTALLLSVAWWRFARGKLFD